MKNYQPKKLVKSNESISRICIVIFLVQITKNSWNDIVFIILQGERYGPMLTAQGGDKILLKLLDEKVESPENMKSMIREIFSELENTNGYKVEV